MKVNHSQMQEQHQEYNLIFLAQKIWHILRYINRRRSGRMYLEFLTDFLRVWGFIGVLKIFFPFFSPSFPLKPSSFCFLKIEMSAPF